MGETHCAPGYSIGFLEQKPKLDPAKTVIEVVREAVKETADLLQQFEAISAKFAEPMSDDEMNALLEKQGALQDKLDAPRGLGYSTAGWSWRWTLCAVRRATRRLRSYRAASCGEYALCRLLLTEPDILLWMNRPTTWTPNRSRGWNSI